MVLRTIPNVFLFALVVSASYACRCVPKGVPEIRALFQQDSVETIALVSNAVPSRPYPDINNPNEPIDWTLKLNLVVKGDCSLQGSRLSGSSGAQGSVCGANPVGGFYWVAFNGEERFNTCLFVRKLSDMEAAENQAMFDENQC